MELNGINLNWLGHSGFKIKSSKIIYIDPYNISEDSEKADLILITHSHYDHCSYSDIKKIVKEGTRIFIPADCQSKVARFDLGIKINIIEPEKEYSYNGSLRILTLPAYNKDKPFHPKEEGWVGYLIKFENLYIYHAGDTDNISEMQKLTGYKQKEKKFIALLPIGGRFTMNFEEAAEAAKLIKPNLAIPMHYGNIIGKEEDAQEFFQLCNEFGVKCKILKKNE